MAQGEQHIPRILVTKTVSCVSVKLMYPNFIEMFILYQIKTGRCCNRLCGISVTLFIESIRFNLSCIICYYQSNLVPAFVIEENVMHFVKDVFCI